VEGCGLAVVAGSVWRWKYGKERQRWISRPPLPKSGQP